MNLAIVGSLLVAVSLVAGCGPASSPVPAVVSSPAPTLSPTVTPDPFASVPGIVDSSNHGWPRTVEGANGPVTIPAKPLRIHTVSLGHDEVTYALVPGERVIAVGSFTRDPVYSNVAELARKAPAVSRDPEQILAQKPDIVVASPFANKDLIKALVNVGIPVVQTDLHNDPEGRIQDILFLGYVYGEEERALELAREVRDRHQALTAITQSKPESARPRVIELTSYSDKIYTAGRGSTGGGIIETAGGINAAAEAGIDRNKTTSLEGIIAMSPQVIVISQPADSGGTQFREQLLSDPALAEVPAIKSKRVYLMLPRLFTTLSFWNIRGAEELAKVLWPEDLGNRTFPPFSFPVSNSTPGK